jgi:hypothetical protein
LAIRKSSTVFISHILHSKLINGCWPDISELKYLFNYILHEKAKYNYILEKSNLDEAALENKHTNLIYKFDARDKEVYNVKEKLPFQREVSLKYIYIYLFNII